MVTERTRCYWLVFVKSHVPTDSCVLWAWRGPYRVELQQYGVEDAWGGRSLLRPETLPLELRILRFRSQFTSDLILWMFFSLPSLVFLICKVGSVIQWFPIGWCWLGSIRTLLCTHCIVLSTPCSPILLSWSFCVYCFLYLSFHSPGKKQEIIFMGAVQGLSTLWIVGVEKWSPRVPLNGVKWSLTIHACSSARLRTGLKSYLECVLTWLESWL